MLQSLYYHAQTHCICLYVLNVTIELLIQFHSFQNALMIKHSLESPRNQEILHVLNPN